MARLDALVVKKRSGKLFLGDIGIPSFLYNKIKHGSRPDFDNNSLTFF